MTNYNLLKAAIVAKGLTMAQFADAIGISRQSLTRKMHSKREFSQKEIVSSKEVLGLTADDVENIFFGKSVPLDGTETE